MVGSYSSIFGTWIDFLQTTTCSILFPPWVPVSRLLLTSINILHPQPCFMSLLICWILDISPQKFHSISLPETCPPFSFFEILFNCVIAHPIINIKQTNKQTKNTKTRYHCGFSIFLYYFSYIYVLYYSWHPIILQSMSINSILF